MQEREVAPSEDLWPIEDYTPGEESFHIISKRNAFIPQAESAGLVLFNTIPKDPTSPYTPGSYAYNFNKFGQHLGSIYGLNNNYNNFREDFHKRFGRYPKPSDYGQQNKVLNGQRFKERFGHLTPQTVYRRFGHLSRSEFFRNFGFYPPVNFRFKTPGAPTFWV